MINDIFSRYLKRSEAIQAFQYTPELMAGKAHFNVRVGNTQYAFFEYVWPSCVEHSKVLKGSLIGDQECNPMDWIVLDGENKCSVMTKEKFSRLYRAEA